MTAYTHILVEKIPQRLDEDFIKNMDEADRQKRLAEAAPELLAALDQILNGTMLDRFNHNDDGLLDFSGDRPVHSKHIKQWANLARKALAKATGGAALTSANCTRNSPT